MVYTFPRTNLVDQKKVCVIREYGLSELCVMRESTVQAINHGFTTMLDEPVI